MRPRKKIKFQRPKPKWRLYWPTRLKALGQPVPERLKLARKCLGKGYHEEVHDHAGTIKALERLRAEFPAAERDAERALHARATKALNGG